MRSRALTQQLYSGYRGSGKTTELLRLKKDLEDRGHVEGVVMAKQLWEKEFDKFEGRSPAIFEGLDRWSPELEEELSDLLRALRRTKGFSLFFGVHLKFVNLQFRE